MRGVKIFVGIAVLFVIVLGFFFVKFVAIPEFTSETVTKQYTISRISIADEGPNDVVFKVKEDSRTMYINRGLEIHSLDYFQKHLLDKSASVTVQYFKKSEIGRINRIECDGVEIYKRGA